MVKTTRARKVQIWTYLPVQVFRHQRNLGHGTCMTDSSGNHGEVIAIAKAMVPFALDPLASVTSSDADGGMAWPIPPTSLLLLYLSSPEHNRCIHLIAEGAFGGGLVDMDGAVIPALEDLFEQGSAACLVDLGLDQGVYGNAYLQKVFNRATGRLVMLRRLPAIGMKKRPDGYVQVVRDGFGNERRTLFTADEIIHFRPPCPMGGFYSLPDWIAAAGMIQLAQAATEWNSKFFENGAMPEYAIIIKGGQLSEPQKVAARQFFRREFRGLDNSHKTLLLEFDGDDVEIEFQRITAELKDGDFLKMLDAARDRIHMSHGVPPRLLGIVAAGQLGGGNEITGQLKMFEDMRLAAVRRRWLGQFAGTLAGLGLDPRKIRCRPLDLTPVDTDRAQVKDWLETGIIDRDEARRMAGIGDETALSKSATTTPSGRLAALAKMLAES